MGTLRLGSSVVVPSVVNNVSTPVIDSLSITPTTSQQIITAPSGTNGYSPITVDAVTSSIDANIVAGNIKKDVEILGVTGTYEGSGGGSPYSIQKSVDDNNKLINGSTIIDLTGVTDIDNGALRYAYYENTNISGSVDMSDLINISGSNACYWMFMVGNQDNQLTSVDMSSLINITGGRACSNMFQRRGITSLDLSSLTTINNDYACYSMFVDNRLSTLSLPSLTTINGYQACYSMFSSRYSTFTSVTFPVLSHIDGYQACYGMFMQNTNLTSLSFPALTSTSFGSRYDYFNNMLFEVTGCTVHFPSNLQSVIGSWSDVTTGFGGTNTTILFDLPATE